MKITRDGIEIELTGRELFDAHEEYQRDSRKTDMRDTLLEMFDDDDADAQQASDRLRGGRHGKTHCGHILVTRSYRGWN